MNILGEDPDLVLLLLRHSSDHFRRKLGKAVVGEDAGVV
jgi:hypothetical protein